MTIDPDDVTQRQTPEETPTVHVVSASPRGDRFTPGTLLLRRYRVINLVGRGGMGEVYRADDLKLGQAVALKFIPRELVSDPAMLRMLLDEVRIGRDVSHPNVCRLYDVVEVDGDHFISMQYVDGEDLASLLRRIGRLPVEKAIDIARDLTAGLAAAHERGVIHRDLKPANVMIDGKGRAHVTDFGLAVLTDDPQRRGIAGTPVYMSPEQLAGEPLTTASDVYAIGLILFEMVTGRRMYDGGSITQIAEAHLRPKPRVSPAELPPQVDVLLNACLEEDPAQRPSSARAVLAAFPGGDPLAAAVAAGETPSPELVAAAAKTGEVPASIAFGGLALFIALLAGVALLNPRTTLFSRERLRKPPEVLVDRAEDIIRVAGLAGEPGDHFGWFADRGPKVDDRNRLIYIYRRSPAPLESNALGMRVETLNPPLAIPGMANVELAADGRLLSLIVVPSLDVRAGSDAIDVLFRGAGLERSQFTPGVPRLPPPIGSDVQSAWDGPRHVEAAFFRGAPVWFAVDPRPVPLHKPVMIMGMYGVVWNATELLILAVGIAFAWRNVRAGRGDRRGAFRGALPSAAGAFVDGVLTSHFGPTAFVTQFLLVLAWSALWGTLFGITYLAIEPYVRRSWPTLLISWQRLVDLRWRDSLVARDVGLGLVTGALSMLLLRALRLAGGRVPQTARAFLDSLASPAGAIAWPVHAVHESMINALGALLLLMLTRLIFRRPAVYLPVFAIVIAAGGAGNTGNTAFDLLFGIASAVLLLFVIRTGGMLAVAVTWLLFHVLDGMPLTTELSAWFAARGLIVALLFVGLALYAALTALQPGRRFAKVPAAA